MARAFPTFLSGGMERGLVGYGTGLCAIPFWGYGTGMARRPVPDYGTDPVPHYGTDELSKAGTIPFKQN